MIVAVLGTGIMGAGMAGSLLRAGFEVRVWNRTEAELAPLVERGAVACATPVEAVGLADVVVTMLSDGPAVASVMGVSDETGAAIGGATVDGALPAMRPGALWLQTTTIGCAWTQALAAAAARRGVDFVDAPVLGSREPAETGDLVVLASGDDLAIDRAMPVFDAIGRRTARLGPVGAGSSTKLVVNEWIISYIGVLAETLAFAKAIGVDARVFLDLLEGGPLFTPHAAAKTRAILDEQFETQLALRWAHKDLGLILEAGAQAGVSLGVTQAVHAAQARAIADGHGAEDMSAVAYGVGRAN
jgi:3-hydroxyisobutyrate dehydrogenase